VCRWLHLPERKAANFAILGTRSSLFCRFVSNDADLHAQFDNACGSHYRFSKWFRLLALQIVFSALLSFLSQYHNIKADKPNSK